MVFLKAMRQNVKSALPARYSESEQHISATNLCHYNVTNNELCVVL